MKKMFSVVALVAVVGCDAGGLGNTNDDGGSADGNQASQVLFRPTIQSDLSSAGCLASSCHGGGGMPMQLVMPPSSEPEWQANYDEVKTRTSTLISKSSGGGGHTASLAEGDAMLVRWQAWIDAGAPYEETATTPDAGAPADAGPLPDAPPGGLTWDTSIAQMLVNDGCTVCHGLHGAYSLETYSGALGFGTDQTIPNVIPGDASSLLITYYDNQHHTTSESNAAAIREWIVDQDAEE